jgi:hypothetical protein
MEDKERVVAVEERREWSTLLGRVEEGREGVCAEEVTEWREVTLDEAGLLRRAGGEVGSEPVGTGVAPRLRSTSCMLASVSVRVVMGREKGGGDFKLDGDWALGGGGGGEVGMSAGLRTIAGRAAVWESLGFVGLAGAAGSSFCGEVTPSGADRGADVTAVPFGVAEAASSTDTSSIGRVSAFEFPLALPSETSSSRSLPLAFESSTGESLALLSAMLDYDVY